MCRVISVCLPIDRPVRVQQFEDGFAIHFCRDVNTGHVQQRRRQVNIQHDVRVTAERRSRHRPRAKHRQKLQENTEERKENHSHGALFHVRPSDEEGNADVKLIRHRLALNQTELADMVAVVRGVDEVGVVQLARLHQHVENLQMKPEFKTHTVNKNQEY